MLIASSFVFAAAGGIVGAVPTAAVANCTVTSTGDADSIGAVPSTSTAGGVSLRSATSAHNAGFGTISIDFNLPTPSMITLTGSLPISGGTPLTITGPGVRNLTIDGNVTNQGFDITSGTSSLTNVTLTNVTLTDNTNAGGNEASAIDDFGPGDLNLINVTVAGDTSTGTHTTGEPQGAIGVYTTMVNFVNTIVANNTPRNCVKATDGMVGLGL